MTLGPAPRGRGVGVRVRRSFDLGFAGSSRYFTSVADDFRWWTEKLPRRRTLIRPSFYQGRGIFSRREKENYNDARRR